MFCVGLLFIGFNSTVAQDLFEVNDTINFRLSVIHESKYHQINSTPLNVNNKLVPQVRYNSYFSADLFLNWHAFSFDIKGNANYNERDKSDFQYLVREFYFDHALGDYLHVTVGRKILKWGTGYAFNPTGVVEPQKEASDPSDRLNRFQGRQIFALDAYLGSHSLTLIYANELRFNEGFNRGKNEFALRFYSLVGDVDVSLIGYWKEKEKSKVGFNTAFTYGTHLEFHSEFITQIGTNKQYHQILDSTNYQIYFGTNPYSARYRSSKQLFYKLLLGAQYIFNSGLSFMAEYYYNRAGLSRSEWEQWRNFTLFHQKQITEISPNPTSVIDFYHALKTLDRDGTLRHYGFIRAYLPLQKSGLELILYENLVDWSGIFISTFNYYFNSHTGAWIRVSYYRGKEDSEFGMLFSKSAIQVGVRISF